MKILKEKSLHLLLIVICFGLVNVNIAQELPETEEEPGIEETTETALPPETRIDTIQQEGALPSHVLERDSIDKPPEFEDYFEVESEKIEGIDWDNRGVSVSPSSMHISVIPGTSQVKEITVRNITRNNYSFRADFSDFEMTADGKPGPPEGDGRYALSRYMGINPSFFELGPGEEIKIRATISIPDEEDSYTAKWTIVTIEQVEDREPLDPGDQEDRLALGIMSTFGFGVYIYQNPPHVILNKIDFVNFEYIEDEISDEKNIVMEIENSGDGISYCRTYFELTNLNTGEQQRMGRRNFTILPQFNRVFKQELPADLSPGLYSAIGVVDYGDREEILAAEIEFQIE